MKKEVPIEYINTYYENRIKRRLEFPSARVFYENELKHVDGSRVINLGCGPQFYDDLRHFKNLPTEYYGLDINNQNINFLKKTSHPEVEKGRILAYDNKIRTDLVNADILDKCISFKQIDCAVSIGFLGIFTEKPFKKAIHRIKNWLSPSGSLVILSWCDNFQEKECYQGRLKYRFNYPNNPGHDDIIQWVTDCDLVLKHEAEFDVPDKKKYGWGIISSCVYKF